MRYSRSGLCHRQAMPFLPVRGFLAKWHIAVMLPEAGRVAKILSIISGISCVASLSPCICWFWF